jgi:hypothetical protein
MSILVAIVLGVFALAFVLYPLYHRPFMGVQMPISPLSAPYQGEGEHEEGSPTERERSARNELQEIELDYQLGNISESDYTLLRERYMRRALIALKSRYDREQEFDEVIEEKLRQMKESNHDATE